MNAPTPAPSLSVSYAGDGTSTQTDERGMRPMQQRAFQKRGEQYLLIKSPPASGKSRALMFIALDKLRNQNIKQAIVIVPEKVIGASFADAPLSQSDFPEDWKVPPNRNLCNAPGTDGGKVNAVKSFLESTDEILVCTHATFRFAVDKFGIEAFDHRLLAIDEFHHISAHPNNRLGETVSAFMNRDRVHIVAMTGSYFRGDAVAVLAPQDEEKFDTVTYTYWEQLNGYQYLKRLDIGYCFYAGSYIDDIMKALDPAQKTILHIPNVNSRESTKQKIREVEQIIDQLGEWQGTDTQTGFQLVKTQDGKILRIADLVDDDPSKRERVSAALKDPRQNTERDHVDIIIALGMAKEGFDWIWCEHTLTVGYRSSLTEIVQIIGRATRDAPGKTRARFTNLIAEPDASEQTVAEAVNDTLKAIAASLLMEQVLAPRFEFKPKNPLPDPAPEETPQADRAPARPAPESAGEPAPGLAPELAEETAPFTIDIKGLKTPATEEGKKICREDITELVAAFVQDKTIIERGMFDPETMPEELTQLGMGKIVKTHYPTLPEEDQEAVRQQAVATFHVMQNAKPIDLAESEAGESPAAQNTAFVQGTRKFALNVRELDIDLIDRINPFAQAYAVMAKTMNAENLKRIQTVIAAKKTKLTMDEARDLARRALQFKRERGRLPAETSQDPWEKRMAEGVAFLVRKQAEANRE